MVVGDSQTRPATVSERPASSQERQHYETCRLPKTCISCVLNSSSASPIPNPSDQMPPPIHHRSWEAREASFRNPRDPALATLVLPLVTSFAASSVCTSAGPITILISCMIDGLTDQSIHSFINLFIHSTYSICLCTLPAIRSVVSYQSMNHPFCHTWAKQKEKDSTRRFRSIRFLIPSFPVLSSISSFCR